MNLIQKEVNNTFYETLGDSWYVGQDHPIALLRAEARLKNPWVAKIITERVGPSTQVLDIGCGGGLLSNDLARRGFQVTGVDISEGALNVARQADETRSVRYQNESAENLSFLNESFDAVCCLDVLEHVSDVKQVVYEACRVLRPGGVFLFHTFNRTLLSRLLIIYGVELFFKNVPENLHLYSKFIKPKEVAQYCLPAKVSVVEWTGIRVVLNWKTIKEVLLTREVPADLSFKFCKSLQAGYLGVAVKEDLL